MDVQTVWALSSDMQDDYMLLGIYISLEVAIKANPWANWKPTDDGKRAWSSDYKYVIEPCEIQK